MKLAHPRVRWAVAGAAIGLDALTALLWATCAALLVATARPWRERRPCPRCGGSGRVETTTEAM